MASDLPEDSRSSITADSDPESVRRAYLRQESNVKSIGQLCFLVCFFSALGTLEFYLFAKGILAQPPEMKAVAPPELTRILFWGMTIAFLINTLVQLVLGYGLIRLQAWARWTVVVLTLISLVGGSLMSLASCLTRPVPGLVSLVVGLVFHVMILFPLLTPAVGFVFTPAYRGVLKQTPRIKSRMHWLLKLLIALILAGFLGILGLLLGLYLRIGAAEWLTDRLLEKMGVP